MKYAIVIFTAFMLAASVAHAAGGYAGGGGNAGYAGGGGSCDWDAGGGD